MNGFAYWNDIYFSNSYSKFHGSDNSLVCSNNILYYKGQTTPIVGNYLIKKNECVDLSSFKVSSIDNQVWALEPHELFFWIRETVCLNNLSNEELNSRLNQFANLFTKYQLNDQEKNIVSGFIDYYSSLKTIEKYLRYNLLDALNIIETNIIDKAKAANVDNLTPGYRMIYEKLNIGQNDQSSSMSNGHARSLNNGYFKSYVTYDPNAYTTSLNNYLQETPNKKEKDAAFASVYIVTLLALAAIVGIMTYLFT